MNDSLGHVAGDELLVQIGRRLQRATRRVDIAARFGGDEFAMLLHDVDDADHASVIVERVLEAVREPVLLEGRQVTISASIGVTMIDGEQTTEILRNADAAMYAAKELGKNCFALFQPAMHEEAQAHRQLRGELEDALAEERFVVHYQPIMDLATETAVGVEALVRWEHPSLGLIPPERFIPLAEETGLIVPLGRWVLDEACHEVASWPGSPDAAPSTLAVNLSGVQLRSSSLMSDVASALERSGLQPAQLTLEITETALIEDTEMVCDVLTELRDLGVRIAVDDFGTGYSSFSRLNHFPVDIIKIGREFVGVINDGTTRAALAEAIVRLAGTFHVHTVAEGVEEPEQLVALASWGCTHAQGWLFAPARPADQIRETLQTRSDGPTAGFEGHRAR